MKKLIKQLRGNNGFTLIELLIVIAIIGILAIALIAAINPLEQMKKSRDTGKLAEAKDLAGAYERFFTTKGCHPQQYAAGVCSAATFLYGATNAANPAADIAEMTTEQELKATFAGQSVITNGYLFVGITAGSVTNVCFPAESQMARSGGLGPLRTLVTTDGSVTAAGAATCNAAYAPGSNDDGCMVCVQ